MCQQGTLSHTITNNVNFKVHHFYKHLFLHSHFDFQKSSGKFRSTRELSQTISENENIVKGRDKTVYSYLQNEKVGQDDFLKCITRL